MSDTADATYIIPNWAHDLLSDHIKEKAGVSISESADGLSFFYLDEVNYGYLRDLEDLLDCLEIPYDHDWAPGNSFDAGGCERRLDDLGNSFVHMVDDGKIKAINPSQSRGELKDQPLKNKERLFLNAASQGIRSVVDEMIKAGANIHYVSPASNMNAMQEAHTNHHYEMAAYVESLIIKDLKGSTIENTGKRSSNNAPGL